MPDPMTLEQQFESGVSHHQARRLAEAERIYRQILAYQPDHAEALHLLGVLAAQVGKSGTAVELIQRALRLKPDFAEAYGNLGLALQGNGQLDEAIAAYRQAIRLDPDLAEVHSNLGNALQDKEQFDEAIACHRQAIRLRPDSATAHHNLGNALNKLGRLDEAIGCYRQAVGLEPDFAEAHASLGGVLEVAGQLDEAIAACRSAIRLKPDYADGHINLLYALYHHPDYDSGRILEETRQWARRQRIGATPYSPPRDGRPERRLKIGYLSPFLRTCADAHYIFPLLARHDRKQFEISCYARMTHGDELTDHLRSHCDHWFDTRGLSTEASAELIRGHGIDILVNISRPADECLRIMANRLAPIQVTWLTFASRTSGLETVDYRISDPYLDPAGTDELCYAEKTLRLPETAWCYDPLVDPPPVKALPAQAGRFITFGSLNRLSKINPSVVGAWAEILRAVPNSRLHILAVPGSHRQRLLDQFRELGVDPGRIEFIDRRPRREYLKQYDRIDVTLDTFPFSGHTTALDSLWMGVPVVTLSGRTSVGRVACSALHNLGLAEWIGQTPSQYVSLAVRLSGDAANLAELRRTLRARMQRSPLMDAPRFARNIEAAYRQMWRNWCEKGRVSGLQCPVP
jgi:predicted O-linked N-acetylglucosamine transferase (SPINDLY family)